MTWRDWLLVWGLAAVLAGLGGLCGAILGLFVAGVVVTESRLQRGFLTFLFQLGGAVPVALMAARGAENYLTEEPFVGALLGVLLGLELSVARLPLNVLLLNLAGYASVVSWTLVSARLWLGGAGLALVLPGLAAGCLRSASK